MEWTTAQDSLLLYCQQCVWLIFRTAFVFSFQGSFTVMGVVSGPLLGIFILGMFVPATNRLVSCELMCQVVGTVVCEHILLQLFKSLK